MTLSEKVLRELEKVRRESSKQPLDFVKFMLQDLFLEPTLKKILIKDSETEEEKKEQELLIEAFLETLDLVLGDLLDPVNEKLVLKLGLKNGIFSKEELRLVIKQLGTFGNRFVGRLQGLKAAWGGFGTYIVDKAQLIFKEPKVISFAGKSIAFVARYGSPIAHVYTVVETSRRVYELIDITIDIIKSDAEAKAAWESVFPSVEAYNALKASLSDSEFKAMVLGYTDAIGRPPLRALGAEPTPTAVPTLTPTPTYSSDFNELVKLFTPTPTPTKTPLNYLDIEAKKTPGPLSVSEKERLAVKLKKIAVQQKYLGDELEALEETDRLDIPQSPTPRMKGQAGLEETVDKGIASAMQKCVSRIGDNAAGLAGTFGQVVAQLGYSLISSTGQSLLAQGTSDAAEALAEGALGDPKAERSTASSAMLAGAGAGIMGVAEGFKSLTAAAKGGVFGTSTPVLMGEAGREVVMSAGEIGRSTQPSMAIGTWMDILPEPTAQASRFPESRALRFARLEQEAKRREGRPYGD